MRGAVPSLGENPGATHSTCTPPLGSLGSRDPGLGGPCTAFARLGQRHALPPFGDGLGEPVARSLAKKRERGRPALERKKHVGLGHHPFGI